MNLLLRVKNENHPNSGSGYMQIMRGKTKSAWASVELERINSFSVLYLPKIKVRMKVPVMMLLGQNKLIYI